LKKESLLDVLLESEMRLDSLLALKEGPRDLEMLLRDMNADEETLLFHMNTLQEYYLVSDNGERYGLTTIGEVIADEMMPLLEHLDELEKTLGPGEGFKSPSNPGYSLRT